MRQAAGQAAKDVAGGVGRVVHRLVQMALALVILLAIGLGALSWRLSQGPLEIAWLARRMVAMANAGGGSTTVSVRTAALVWQGLRVGLDSSLELELGDVRIDDAHGRPLLLPRAAVSLAPSALLRGRLALRSAELDGIRLRLIRTLEGAVTLDAGTSDENADTADSPQSDGTPLAALVAALAAPAGDHPGDAAMWSQIRRLRVHDAAVTVTDRKLGVVWRAPGTEIELTRAQQGGANGRARLTLAAGDQQVTLDTRLALLPGDGGVTLAGQLSTVNPAHLAGVTPILAPLAAVDAPLTVSGTLTLGADLGLRAASVAASLGTGTLHAGTGTVPVEAMTVSAQATPDRLDLRIEKLVLRARPEADPTTITATVAATRAAGRLNAKVVVDLDHVDFVDLPALWPAGVGGPGTRPWIVANLTAGQGKNGHVELALTAPEDLSDAQMTSISGGFEASDVTTHWLRPVPPIEHGEARLAFVDPDTADVLISSGRQGGTNLAIRSGKVRLTGLAAHDQFIAIQADIGGPFADVVTLLHHPKIGILDRRPIPMNNPSGQVTTNLTVNMPLKTDLNLDNVAIHAIGKLSQGHIGGVAAGRDLDRANLDVDVSNDGMKLNGTANIADVPAMLDVTMDFRPGGPAQIIQAVHATATVAPAQLTRLGLDTQGVFAGSAGLDVTYSQRRDGAGTVLGKADLSRASLAGGRLRWQKAAGSAGSAEISLRLDHDRIVAIDRVRAEAPALSIQASADMAGGRASVLRVQRLMVGEGTDLSGEIRLPAHDGQAYVVNLSGSSIDLSGEMDRKGPPQDATPDSRGPAFVVDARVGRVVTGKGRQLSGVVVHLENDGQINRSGHFEGRAGDGAFALNLVPVAGGRRLTGSAADAGGLLRALDVMSDMHGGTMRVNGAYDDTTARHTLTATTEIDRFRIQNAPAIGRLLQAMSLYGLLELAKGPGLGFDRLVAPFSLQNQVLTLSNARAFSASLGMTAKGRIDLARRTAAIEGTIVPIYFFNTLLGRVPLVGRLFSPETGGGLFAATYSLNGALDDPGVSVNPLATLTPGVLRGLFDIFDAPADGRRQPTPSIQDEIQR